MVISLQQSHIAHGNLSRVTRSLPVCETDNRLRLSLLWSLFGSVFMFNCYLINYAVLSNQFRILFVVFCTWYKNINFETSFLPALIFSWGHFHQTCVCACLTALQHHVLRQNCLQFSQFTNALPYMLNPCICHVGTKILLIASLQALF